MLDPETPAVSEQQWPLTRITGIAFHHWDTFITPAELTATRFEKYRNLGR